MVIVFFCHVAQLVKKQHLQTVKGFFYTLVVLAIIPGLVVIEDLGTAIAIAGALVCMMIAAEVPWRYLGCTVGLRLSWRGGYDCGEAVPAEAYYDLAGPLFRPFGEWFSGSTIVVCHRFGAGCLA